MTKSWEILEQSGVCFENLDSKTKQSIAIDYGNNIKAMALRVKSSVPDSVLLDDLISAGSLGFVESLYRYNPETGIKFSSFADIRIKGAMIDELRKSDKISRQLRQKIREIESVQQNSVEELSYKEIAEKTSLSEEEIEYCLSIKNNYDHLNIDEIEEITEFECQQNYFEQPQKQVLKKETIDNLVENIKKLSEREQLILSLYYEKELNMLEIGKILKVSEGRISQLHGSIIKKIKEMFSNQ